MSKFNLAELREDIVFETRLRGQEMEFHSTWGLFSPTEVDEGSKMLLEEINVQANDSILEIGCGYGPIGLTIAKMTPQGSVHLLDKDFVAVDFARKNAEINGLRNCEMYLSNAFSHVPDLQFDQIVSNLPAKVGREMLYVMLTDAKNHLKPGGKLSVVVIAGLKEYIKRNFQEVFGNYRKLRQGKTYMVAEAVREE